MSDFGVLGPEHPTELEAETVVPGIPSRRTPYIQVLNGNGAGRLQAVSAEVVVGRAHDADLVLDDAVVSRRHARVRFVDGVWEVTDEGSSNGVRVGGERVSEARLRNGDTFSLGASVVLKVGEYDEVEVALLRRLVDVADASTGLTGRHAFETLARERFERARRLGAPFVAAVVAPEPREPDVLRRVADRLAARGALVGAADDGTLTLVFTHSPSQLPLRPTDRAGVAERTVHETLEALFDDARRRLTEGAALPQAAATAPQPPVGDGRGAAVRLHLFGRMRAEVGGRIVDERDWRTQKVKFLLASLLHRGARGISDDEAIDIFWPDADPLHGRKSLNAALVDLRRVLRVGATQPVLREGDRIFVNPALSRWDDVGAFEAWLRAAADARRAGADVIPALSAAVALYAGPYLDGCYLDWACDLRATLERQAADAMFELAFALLAAGAADRALAHAEAALAIDALHVESHALVMRAHAVLGRADRAVRHFERCTRRFREELGVEPPVALVEECLRARLGIGPGPAMKM